MSVDVFDLETHDPDIAHEVINRIYAGERSMAFSGDPTGFAFRIRSLTVGDLGADRMRHTMATRAMMHPFDTFMAATVLGGTFESSSGQSHTRCRAGDVSRYPTETDRSVNWSDIDVAVIRVPMSLLERVVRAQLGVDTAVPHFEGVMPVSASMARQWRSLTGFVHRELEADNSVLANPLIETQLTELVAATALAVFPNTMMTATSLAGSGRVGAATIRRATAFIEANAARPITVTDIAQATGVSVRALQMAFRRTYETTPTGYLRRVRLDRAHRDLRAADPTTGATVGEVAARWGFARSKRFESCYREQFGVLPDRTLHM